MDLVDLIVEKRNEIKATCNKHGATDVRIFGSCARNDYDEKSDIDVLVRFEKEKGGWEFFDLLDALKADLEKQFGVKVDVVDEDGLRGAPRKIILQEAIAL